MRAALYKLAALWLCIASVLGDNSTHNAAIQPTSSSLCGEQLTHHTGFLHGLYYLFYESSAPPPAHREEDSDSSQIPVVLWLSGGPGCSGLVAALFEIGPCTFNDETNEMAMNKFPWTTSAHVVFVDQPHGTGFSGDRGDGEEAETWTERQAMTALASFVDAFFAKNPWLQENDFYIFGESFGGHYAPDLGALLVKNEPAKWRNRLKGVAIGNGIVSPIANLQTYLEFARHNKYANDLLGSYEEELVKRQQLALELSLQCRQATTANHHKKPTAPHISHRRMRAVAFESDSDNEDAAAESQVCQDAYRTSVDFEGLALATLVDGGYNMYDVRRKCHTDDPVRLCYRFSRLTEFVNQPAVLEYLDGGRKAWALCDTDVMRDLRPTDFIEESQDNVAFLLANDVRVLVYAGDADAMAGWELQERWTQDLQWEGHHKFQQSPTTPWLVDGERVGTVRTVDGLSLARVFESGHMVPHDQPKVALELLRAFVGQNDGSLFS